LGYIGQFLDDRFGYDPNNGDNSGSYRGKAFNRILIFIMIIFGLVRIEGRKFGLATLKKSIGYQNVLMIGLYRKMKLILFVLVATTKYINMSLTKVE
jgi:hypothetical protein